ncbi:YitT family protein [Marinomonas balearica]|uniref:Putative 5xTM membrane YitT family protein n=1 Tax=Marinomonas balearica TaxID=491947 RepID=A0A4R6MB23_9GAMM|nr:YitT family protein [Marinomonas balearica]TDO98673.1 putative 5xTM membrane YitT family protein [Marinomonas balearica]
MASADTATIAKRTSHTYFEDAQALFVGSVIIALGINLFTQAGLLTGGTAGLAFLTQYATSFTFGQAFFVINLPFYYLAYRTLGLEFTLKTFLSVFMVSVFSEWTSHFVTLESINSVYAAFVGGFLIGAGFLMLFRHNASLGGINILAKYMADKHGWSIGKFQMVVDTCIVIASIFIVDWELVIVSIMGAISLNIILAVNHKPGRYNPGV